jgi:hypothetical protein
MNIDNLIKNNIKTTKQHGNRVLVFNGNDQLISIHSTIELGKSYFSMSNDDFYNFYGFNFVPEGKYWELSKRASEKM